MSMRPHATCESWKHLPMPEAKAPVALHRSFSEGDYQRLKAGVIPEEMDDRWFIYWEDDTLYFHRSWTGYCLFEVLLEREGAGYRIREARVNRDPGQGMRGAAKENAAYEQALLAFLIDRLLLGEDVPFPLVDQDTGLVRHMSPTRTDDV